MKDVMVDIETMGTRSTSLILQIGACYFDRETGEIGDTFIQNIDYDSLTQDLFTVDKSTIDWWLLQSEEARKSVSNEFTTTIDVTLDLFKMFLERGAKYIWSHATFDVPIILNAFNEMDIEFPIHYTKMRDIRTLMDISGHKSSVEREGTHHDALDDCKFQVAYCVEALNKIAL